MRVFVRTDLEDINKWLEKRSIKPLSDIELPKVGLIEEGVAVGFLCQTDTNVCFLEAFITNPDAGLKERSETIYKIAKRLLAVATNAGYARCVILTSEQSLMGVAKELGFTNAMKETYGKDL